MAIKLVSVIFALLIVRLADANLTLLVNKSFDRYHPCTTIEKAIYK